ncbi:class I glutamine amidotransferase-like protein [Crucibulum laeve]|uniref:Class I glutamine amidotransferase-like protein n=1 Tax=Crucibulum laeve TaxID=68775 RepID=A0A5C3MKM6_9AGAR|nr:class I glutamine amidotransferase-like protein [Crucibulum laeve]
MSTAPVSVQPINFGVLVFPAFQALDVFGPLDALNMLSLSFPLNLSIIASTLSAVSTRPTSATMNPHNSNFSESIMPTHTFDNPPADLEVLIVPGGLGTRAPNLDPTIDFVRRTYPQLKYLITVCTGAGIAARAGVLDGRRATTNKRAWTATTALGPNVNWVTHARWVHDGNIWTSSGVSAGIDTTLAFVEEIYGSEAATNIANGMEYERHTDPSWDPFADLYNL